MATTLLKKEFDCIYCDAIDAFNSKVDRLAKNNMYGIDDSNLIKEIKLLFVYINSLWSWEQDEFSYTGYPNFINDYMVRAILSDIREMI